MAYATQETKSVIKQALLGVIPKDWKYSLSIQNHSCVVLTIKSAPIDLIECVQESRKARWNGEEEYEKPSHVGLNVYWLDDQFKSNTQLAEKFKEILTAMKSADWCDESDSQTDYFHTAYYIDIQLGKWNKPFEVK